MAMFYLGQIYDPNTKQANPDQPIMYDARDLTTHAVCVGMTGSGKTGLCIDLLEEAALDGVPALIIDPKGDMTNLLLTFPDLAPADFEPWVNVDDARRKGQTTAEYAAATAATWVKGIEESKQSRERIRRLKEAADFTIYTPGSDAGIPLSVLQSFDPPADLNWDDDEETLRDLVSGTISGLLGLVGIEADPVRSREHILLSNLFERAWRSGRGLDLAQLIQLIQRPPITKLGVMDLDTIYPEKDRFELAMMLNNVLASPSFENWRSGEPLDIERLMHTPASKPRMSIIYIAHLSDAERMFFVTLLLERVISWMRKLSGTTSLRGLLYMDEIFGFFPPIANPPSKRPLLTLLKQARAFGLGVMLTTQNPVDLDYKGLANAGTWFIGKLQTERDKARLLEGMESAASSAGEAMDRAYLDKLISGLDSRVFVLHNVHGEGPLLFKTRFAMSYLRGPLTRSQVRTLMSPLKSAQPQAATRGSQPTAPFSAKPGAQEPETPAGYAPVQPRVNARVAQYFAPAAISEDRIARDLASRYGRAVRIRELRTAYEPYLLGVASVLYGDAARTRSSEQRLSCLAPLPAMHALVDWGQAVLEEFKLQDLTTTPYGEALYGSLPEGMAESSPYTQLRAAFEEYVYRASTITTWQHPALKLASKPGEAEREFKVRCQEEARKQRDKELAQVTKEYERKLTQLQDKLEREQRELELDTAEFEGRKRDELLSAGESLVGMVLGRRRSSALSKASTKRRQTAQAKADVRESEQVIARLQEEIAGLQQEQEQALEQVRAKWADEAMQLEQVEQRPRKSDIHVDAFGLTWVPFWFVTYEDERSVAHQEKLPAYPLP